MGFTVYRVSEVSGCMGSKVWGSSCIGFRSVECFGFKVYRV